MKRRSVFWGFGAVLLAIALYGLIFTRKRSPFEDGYGMPYAGQEISAPTGSNTFLLRFYASPEPGLEAAERIGRKIGRKPNSDFPNYYFWTIPDGEVELYEKPLAWPSGGWPKGAKSYLITVEKIEPNILHRAAIAVGIRL